MFAVLNLAPPPPPPAEVMVPAGKLTDEGSPFAGVLFLSLSAVAPSPTVIVRFPLTSVDPVQYPPAPPPPP